MKSKIVLTLGLIAVFVSGGTFTVFGVKFDLPALSSLNLKRFIVSQEEVVERFWQYESDHPVILWEATLENGDITRARLDYSLEAKSALSKEISWISQILTAAY